MGPCAAIAKSKWITALTIRHNDRDWETLPNSLMVLNNFSNQTRFQIEFRDAVIRKRLIVKGCNLHRVFNLIIQGRMEWITAIISSRHDQAADGETVITEMEVIDLGEKPEQSRQ